MSRPLVVTVTTNPSIDQTISLTGALARGEVQRAQSVSADPGGKGVNVSRAVHAAGVDTLAVLPAAPDDAVLAGLDRIGLRTNTIPVDHATRTNVTITEPDGTTTKLNAPGNALTQHQAAMLTDRVIAHAEQAAWVVLSGSLNPGLAPEWYRDVAQAISSHRCRVAVDTSGLALAALAPQAVGVTMIKPNAEELTELAKAAGVATPDTDPEIAAAQGDPLPAAELAGTVGRLLGVDVLATLGAAGAVLITPDGGWYAPSPKVSVRSTVGAGDCSLSGYLLARIDDAGPAEALASAVAYGAAAAALPGTTVPTPDQVSVDAAAVHDITAALARPTQR